MGLENEKSETSVIMSEDEFTRSFEPFLNTKSSRALPDRDPRDINAHLKISFEDVIAEPNAIHSFDKVWVGSSAGFELIKYLSYRALTTLLAVPLSFVAGLLFALLSCVHIWVLMPGLKSCLLVLPSLQKVWDSLLDTFVAPLSQSAGKCLSTIDMKGIPN
ncbi:caveolin-2 [Scleropages formosus]|uniref:Caveolin n=1 Tax=Scleropages formosus TaxID=113540 RepID=A0A8C9UZR9_SCLFO|nr:caveolin-2-like [Scleropages formosus]